MVFYKKSVVEDLFHLSIYIYMPSEGSNAGVYIICVHGAKRVMSALIDVVSRDQALDQREISEVH